MDAKSKAYVSRDLAQGKLACVVATSTLAQGVDVAGVYAVLLDGPPYSLADAVQMVGRGLRGGPSEVAELSWSPSDFFYMRRVASEFSMGRAGELRDKALPMLAFLAGTRNERQQLEEAAFIGSSYGSVDNGKTCKLFMKCTIQRLY